MEPEGDEAAAPRHSLNQDVNHTDLLARDVAALHAAHRAGTWQPTPAETAAADCLARGQWTGPLFDAVLREAGPALAGGSLVVVLETAAAVLEDAQTVGRPETGEAIVRMRQLVDALAGEALGL